MTGTRYVGYACLDGFASAHPEYFGSIREAAEWLRRTGDAHFLGYDETRDLLDLYRVQGPDDLASAAEFAGVGCPFDYPSVRLMFGPRGGVQRVHV